MAKVSFDVALFPTEPAGETLRLAKLAEKLGYDGVWVGDSHIIWREMYVLLGAIASQTKRVKLGSGVTDVFRLDVRNSCVPEPHTFPAAVVSVTTVHFEKSNAEAPPPLYQELA